MPCSTHATGKRGPPQHCLSRLLRRPVGDGVSRAGIIDSVLLGCIPVLFHPGQHLQWPWHWGAWVHNATVTLDLDQVSKGTLDPIVELGHVPAERIASMQATIAEHAHCLHYYQPEANRTSNHNRDTLLRMPSAFDITLQGSWLHARGTTRNFSKSDLCTSKLRPAMRGVNRTSSGPGFRAATRGTSRAASSPSFDSLAAELDSENV